VVWIRRVLLPNRAPGMELPEFNDLQDLHEVHDMLAERIKKWPERWEEKGRHEGRHEGVEGTLRMQIDLKFGGLPAWVDQRLKEATDEQLNTWSARILTADSIDTLFNDE